jgi:cytochrome b561
MTVRSKLQMGRLFPVRTNMIAAKENTMGEYLIATVRRYLPGRDEVVGRRDSVSQRIWAVASHSRATIIAHWGTMLAIVVAVAAIYLRDLIDDKSIRQFLLVLHKQLGLLVLIIVPIRIAVRFSLGFTDHSGPMAPLLHWAATACHIVLYAALVIVPMLGWATANAHGVAMNFLGLLPLPSIADADPDIADALTDYHVWGFYIMSALVVAHALAAIWHHSLRHDGVLLAMVGGRKERRRTPR